jgi:hypothetical protein
MSGSSRTVAQTGSLLYRRLAVGRPSAPRRLPTCDTADCQSALRLSSIFRFPFFSFQFFSFQFFSFQFFSF